MNPASNPPGRLPDRYAVLGHPVAHSQSPFIHAEFARQTGEHIAYGRIESPLDAFAATVQAFIANADAAANGLDPAEVPSGGLGPARGCNITVPFKFQVLPLARRASARAELAQAANVLRFDADGWFADNTDGTGLVRDIQQHAGLPLRGKRVLLIGAGGAAAGVLGPLIEAGCAAITVANRTPAKALSLVQRHAAWAGQHGVALGATGLADAGTGFDVVINSSASSLAGAGVPVAPTVLRPGALAIDLMYGPAAQPFLDWAAAHGATGRDGLGMLVEQAAGAFELWRGVMPHTPPVLAALRAKLASKA
jgi:shikimate dehydrogenase